MGDGQQLYYWMRVGVLLLVTVLAVVMVVRQRPRRPYSTAREIVLASGHVAAYVVLLLVTGVSVSVSWSALLLAVGLAVGFLAGRASRIERTDGRLMLERVSAGPVVAAVAYVLAAMTLLFGTSYLFALAMVLFALSVGMTVGQAVSEVLRSITVDSAGPQEMGPSGPVATGPTA